MADKKIKIDIEAVDNFSNTMDKLKQKIKEVNDTERVNLKRMPKKKGGMQIDTELGNLSYDIHRLMNSSNGSIKDMETELKRLTSQAKEYIKQLEIIKKFVLVGNAPKSKARLGKSITDSLDPVFVDKIKQKMGIEVSDSAKKAIAEYDKKRVEFQNKIESDTTKVVVKEDKKSVEDTKKKIKDTFKNNKVTQKVTLEQETKVKNTTKEKPEPTQTKIKKETVPKEKPKRERERSVKEETPKVEKPQAVKQSVEQTVKATTDNASVKKVTNDIQKEVDKTPIKANVEINKKDIGKQIVDVIMKEADSQVADMKNMFTNMVKSATKPAKTVEEKKEELKKEPEKKLDIEIAKTPYGRKKQAEEARKVLYPEQYKSKPKEVAKEVKEVDKTKEERLKRLRATNEEMKKQVEQLKLKEKVELELDKSSVVKVNKEAQKELDKKPVKTKKPIQQSLFDESTPTLPSKISKIPVDEKLTKGIQQLPVEGILKKIDLDKNAMSVIAKTLNNLTGKISNISVDNNVLAKSISKTIKDINKTPYTIKIGKDEKYFTKVLNDNIKKASKEVINLKAKIDKVGYDKETLNRFNKELNIKAIINSIKIDDEKLQKIKDRVVKFKAEITNVKINPDSLTAIKDRTINIKGVIKPLTIDKEALDKLKEKEIKLNGVVKGVKSTVRDSSPSKKVREPLETAEKDSYKTLLRQRNNAVVAMDKAWQQAGGNAKNAQFLKARKDYFNAQDRLMNFQSASGLSGLDKVIRDLERRLSLFSSDSKSPIKAAMENKLSEAYTKQSQLQNQLPKGLEQLTISTDNFVNSVAKLAQSLDNARTRILDYENKVRKAIENAKINEEVAKDLETTRHLDIVRKGEQAAAKAKKDAENKAIAEQAAKEVEQQKLLNEFLAAEEKRKAAILKQDREAEIAAQKIVNERQKQLELMAKEAAAWNRVERARDRILAQQDKMSMKNYLQQQATDAIGKPLSTTSRDNFLVDLQMYRDMTNDMSTNFYRKMGQALRIGKDHPYFEALQKLHKESLEAAKAWNESEKKKEKATKESAQNIKSQYQSLAQKAKEFATEAEKAWRMQGGRTSPAFENLRNQFQGAMQNLVDFRRNLGNLSAGAEANIYANMARSLGKASPVYDELIRKAKKLKQEQKEINDALKTKTKGTGDDFHGFSAGNFAIGFMRFVGRAAKGWGSALEAFSVVFDNLRMMGGKLGVLGTIFSVFAAGVTGVVTVLGLATQGLQFFGNTLIQIGQSIYQALQPGIELYKQQQSAIFSFTAALKSNGVVSDKESPLYGQRLSTMGDEGTSIARGLSASLIQRAILDAEMSAFNLEELLRSLQGTLPLLLGRGMSVEQAYEVNKGVASVAKLTQLTPSQILQETRDLAEGSITSRGSQVANALGITNADLEQYKGNADALFNFLMEKFKAYGEMLSEFEDTAIGRWQQLQERYQNVTKNIVEGIAPMFKGVFEEIINWTGQWQDKNGNYLDAIAGVWKTKTGEIIGTIKEVTEAQNNLGVDMKSVEFIPSEELQKIKEALQDIVYYVAITIDGIMAWAEEIFGVVDTIDAIKTGIKMIIDGFVICLGVVAEVFEWLLDNYDIVVRTVQIAIKLGAVLQIIASIIMLAADGFALVLKTILTIGSVGVKLVKIFSDWQKVLIKSTNILTKLFKGDFSGAMWEVQKSVFGVLQDAGFEDLGFKDTFKDVEADLKTFEAAGKVLFSSMPDDLSAIVKDFAIPKERGKLSQAVTAYSEAMGRAKQQGDAQGLQHGDIRGVPKEDTKEAAKAAKQALKEAQKALKEAIEKLKQELKDKLDELKEAQEKDDIAYKEGFMSMKDYYTQKALREQEEAQLRLEEARAERDLIDQTPFENEYDKLKELHKVSREIREYERAVAKTSRAQEEVSKNLGQFTKAMQVVAKMQGQFVQTMMNTKLEQAVKQGQASYVKGHTAEKLTAFGLPKEYLNAVMQNAQKYANEYIDSDALAKLSVANMKQESSFNPNAGSSAGAYGLMQLMAGTAQDLGVDRYDVLQNIEGGIKYLADLVKTFKGDISLAVGSYNAGPGYALKYGSLPNYEETLNHVKAVQDNLVEINKQNVSESQELGTNIGNSITNAIEIALRGRDGKGGYLGQTLMHGRVACVEAGTKLGAYFSDALKEAVDEGIVHTDVLDNFLQSKGVPDVKWDSEGKGKLKPGDIIFFDSPKETNAHVMVYKGDNFLAGNFSSRNNEMGAVGEQDFDEYVNAVRESIGYEISHFRQTGTYGLAKGFGGSSNTAVLEQPGNIRISFADKEQFTKSLEPLIAGNEELRQIVETLFKATPDTTKSGYEVNEEVGNKLVEVLEARAKRTSRVTGNTKENQMLIFVKGILNILKRHSEPELVNEEIKNLELALIDDQVERISSTANTMLANIEYNLNQRVKDLNLGRIDATSVADSITKALTNRDFGLAQVIEDLEKAYERYIRDGMIADAQRVRNTIDSMRKTVLDYYDKMREAATQSWDASQKIFNAMPKYTSTQREFAEREFPAYRAQAELPIIDKAIADYPKLFEASKQKLDEYNASLLESREKQKGLNSESQDYQNIQKEINRLTADIQSEENYQRDLDYRHKRNLQEKELLEILKQQPQYLADIANAANEALDKGLNELLTDGVNNAKSLGEAFRNLAIGVLKEIQRVSAKWLVKGFMNKFVGQFRVDEQGNSQMGVQATTQALVTTNQQLNATGQMLLQALGVNVGATPMQTTTPAFRSTEGLLNVNNPFAKPWEQSTLNPNAQAPQQQPFTFDTGINLAEKSAERFGTALDKTATMQLPTFDSGIKDVTKNLTSSGSIDTTMQQVSAKTSTVFETVFAQFQTAGEQLVQAVQSVATRLQSVMFPGGVPGAYTGGFVKNNKILKLARGGAVYHNSGLVTGYGTSTSDDIPAMLSNGEAVLNAKAVKRLGLNFISAVNNGEFSKIRATIPHFASGGVVGEAQQFTARGMTDFAKGIGTEVSTTNNMNIALVRDEQEAIREWAKNPNGGQKFIIDTMRRTGVIQARF